MNQKEGDKVVSIWLDINSRLYSTGYGSRKLVPGYKEQSRQIYGFFFQCQVQSIIILPSRQCQASELRKSNTSDNIQPSTDVLMPAAQTRLEVSGREWVFSVILDVGELHWPETENIFKCHCDSLFSTDGVGQIKKQNRTKQKR